MEVHEAYGLDFSTVLRDAVSRKSIDEHKQIFYPGKVVDNNDPDMKGRCRIMVYGVFDDIPTEDLPWAIPDFSFIGSTLGSFTVPPLDAVVNVYFDGGDTYLPKYTTKVISPSGLGDMSSEIGEDYPNTMVLFETDNGDYFKINRKSKEMELHHSSGATIGIDSNGNIKIYSPGKMELKSDGDMTLNSGGEVFMFGTKIHATSLDGTTNLIQPNICTNCLFTAAPHGGQMAGIVGFDGKSA